MRRRGRSTGTHLLTYLFRSKFARRGLGASLLAGLLCTAVSTNYLTCSLNVSQVYLYCSIEEEEDEQSTTSIYLLEYLDALLPAHQ